MFAIFSEDAPHPADSFAPRLFVADLLELLFQIHCQIRIVVLPIAADHLRYALQARRQPRGAFPGSKRVDLSNLRYDCVGGPARRQLECPQGFPLAMGKKQTSPQGQACVDPVDQIGPISMGGIAVDPADGSTHRYISPGYPHTGCPFYDRTAQRALSLIADEEDGRIATRKIVHQVVPDASHMPDPARMIAPDMSLRRIDSGVLSM